MLKKILFILMLMLFPLSINAETLTTFKIDEVTASAGSNVTINFKMDNKEAFNALTAKIHYDNTKLTYVDSELKGLDKGALKGIDKNNDKGLVAIYGISINSKKLMKDNGTIATIEFSINDKVTEDIPLTIEIKDFTKDETTELKYKTIDGVIHIKNNVATVEKNDKVTIMDTIKEELKKQGIDNSDIKLESTDNNVAIVDESGNVKFKNDGNVDIIVKDDNGEVVYSKGYFVKDKIKNNYTIPIIIGGVSLLIIAILFIIIRRKKCRKEK